MKHRDLKTLDHLSNQMASKLRSLFGRRVLGPDVPVVGRVQSMHIRKIVLKMLTADNVGRVRKVLKDISDDLLAQPIANSLKVYFDVDPV